MIFVTLYYAIAKIAHNSSPLLICWFKVNPIAMKTALQLFVATALLVGYSSCKSFKDLSKQKDGDDIYFSQKDAKKERTAEKKRKEEEEKKKAEDEAEKLKQANNAKAMATSPGTDYYNEPFDYDDYYDYEYAARLRRFNHPVPNSGYYGNYYTNAYYYNQDPYYYGTSIYNSYNFWGPSAYAYNYCPSAYYYYNSGWQWGTGMYYGQPFGYYDPWMNNGWGYNPYCGYYSGWNGGWYGPGTALYANYWGGPYLGWGNGNGNYGYGNNYGNGNGGNYYFNSYDENSYYYGPRHSPSSTDGRVPGSGGPAFGERYCNAVGAENGVDNPGIADVNRVTEQSYTANPSTYTPDTRGNTNATSNPGVPAPPSDNNGTTDQRSNTGNTPPAPTFSNTNTTTPPAPDYSRSNTTAQPAPANTDTQSRGSNSGGSGSAGSSPSNSGGNGGSRSSGGSSGTTSRPR